MTNVHDRDFVADHAVIHNIGIAAEPERVHAELGDQPMPHRGFPQFGYALFNEGFHFSRGARVSPIDVFKDSLAIG
jgi:hypothetical protein